MNTRSRTSCAWLVGLIAILTALTGARATDRYFLDQTIITPDGRYQLEAKSPDNAGERPRPFAQNFVYTLREIETGRVLWQRLQDEGSPTMIFINDDLQIVVRTGFDEMFLLEPITAERTLKFAILDQFPDKEQQQFVHWTTAGKMWSGRLRWSFVKHSGRQYFVIRAWWDRRVIVDLDHSKVVTEPGEDLLAACDADDAAFVTRELNAAVEAQADDSEDVDSYERLSRIATAIHLSGRTNAREAILALKALGRRAQVSSSGGWHDFDGVYKDGEINPFNRATLGIRRSTHLALRRLGEKPEELPCTQFRYKSSSGLGETVVLAALPRPRADRVDLIKPGQKPIDVLKAIGSPDYVEHQLTAWEYEMDTDKPYTLRVYWKDKKVVDRCERITPPLWQEGETRYDN